MKKLIWLSFDLGIQGDYESLYVWLDQHEAKECGDSLAAFDFEYSDDLVCELTNEIKKSVEINKKSRFYLIYIDSGKSKGRFIIGSRKSSPWTGFAMKSGDNIDEE